jgi:hypothetical protein
MKRNSFFRLIISLAALIIAVTTAIAAVYTYACPTCGLTREYSAPGNYKCPNDHAAMVLVQ